MIKLTFKFHGYYPSSAYINELYVSSNSFIAVDETRPRVCAEWGFIVRGEVTLYRV